MTVSQLYNSVAQLGFEDSLENDRRFIFAANRALLQVNALRPATNAYIINHCPLENKADKTGYDTIEVTEETYYTAENGKAYYFEVSGNGRLTVQYMNKDGKWAESYHDYGLKGNGFKAYRGMIKADGDFINGSVRLKFSGDYLFYIRNVAIYDRLLSADPEDIPAYGKYARYDISDLADDFLGLATPPIIEYSSDNSPLKYLSEHYDVENGRVILLLNSIKGLFKVMYNRKPREIVNKGSLSTDDTKIDLDEDLAALLPLIIASYVWVEDEPEKAQYYLSLYNDRAMDIERHKTESTPIKFINVTGW